MVYCTCRHNLKLGNPCLHSQAGHRICHPAWGVLDCNSAPGQRSSTYNSSSNRIMGACPNFKLLYILWHWSVAMTIRCALTLFRCDSETSNDHGTKFYFILFDTRQAHSMPWCFTSSKAWQSDLPVFLCSILSLWISCREGTVKCWDNGHVWLSMSFKYPRITLQVVCVQPEGHSIVHQMQVMSVNCWISVDTYLSTFNHIFSSPLTLKFRANGSWNVDCKFFVKYNNSVLGEVGIKWTSKTTTTSEINHKPKKLGPTKKAKRRPTTHQKCLWSCKSPQHNPYS